MTQFHIENIDEVWRPLAEKYRHIYIDPSPEVKNLWEKYGQSGDMPRRYEDLCNLRYGFEMHESFLPDVTKYTEEIQKLLDKAAAAGHDITYKSFIFKSKFGSLRDQGDFYGPDANLYRDEYRELSEQLIRKTQQNGY